VNTSLRRLRGLAACCAFALSLGSALAQTAEEAYKPIVGQQGKDVVWVPTPAVLVEKMMDLAKVTPQDYVMDLGSGDGRNIIAAAKRGARALGVEYNPHMVELASRTATAEGVADRARFVQGDMFEADISEATVLALFLLPDNLNKLVPKFLALKPGTRIVANHFGISGWEADQTERTDGDCQAWCTALLYIVPAQVAGTWRLPHGELALEQQFQVVTGTFSADGQNVPVRNGRLRGDHISFSVGDADYVGRVDGAGMRGSVTGSTHGAWSASRAK
jgi:SAM-dependent methyltransferase